MSNPGGHTGSKWGNPQIIAAIIGGVAVIAGAFISGRATVTSTAQAALSPPSVSTVTEPARVSVQTLIQTETVISTGPTVTQTVTKPGSTSTSVPAPPKPPVLTTAPVAPPAYVKVSLADLCDDPARIEIGTCGSPSVGTREVDGRIWPYVATSQHMSSSQLNVVLQYPARACNKLVITFAFADGESSSKSKALVEVVTGSRAPQEKSGVQRAVQTLTAALDGGVFELKAGATDYNDVYMDGYAMCQPQ